MSAGAASSQSPAAADPTSSPDTKPAQDTPAPSFIPPSTRSTNRADIPPSLRPGYQRLEDEDSDSNRGNSSSIRLVSSSTTTTTQRPQRASVSTPPPPPTGWHHDPHDPHLLFRDGQATTTTTTTPAHLRHYPRTEAQPITDIRLLNGENTPQNVAVYGFGLGALFGAGMILATMVDTSVPQLCFFLAALGVFHSLEYISTALFNPSKLTLDSFLLNHSPEYTLATVSGITEFVVERYFFPQYKRWGYINLLGLVLVVVGQVARTWAMFSAKSNFSHHIEHYKGQHHILVTHGIYSVLRHPSYFGFYYWAVGSQLMMMNPICLVGFAVALYMFFSDRIQYEETLLVRFFGQEYIHYQKRTRTGIPLIA
ncbi:hypothetical protein DFQ26_006266 [Actinomortierella ambigua]|nr:hypothetical protein DFQ26_006266 [Actinomortierella ambigua]